MKRIKLCTFVKYVNDGRVKLSLLFLGLRETNISLPKLKSIMILVKNT